MDHDAPKAAAPARDIRTTRNEIAVDMTGVNKWFGAFHVLRDINLQVMRGEIGRASCRERVYDDV